MSLINRNTDYATRAICFMAKKHNQRLSVDDLVRHLKIPRPFLRKILQILNKKGILKSYKGKGGGFLLKQSPEKIFLIDLINIFQGRLKIKECFLGDKICPKVRSCPLGHKLKDIEDYVIRQLKSLNVASLLS